MAHYNDPYGIGRLKEKEKLERERNEKQDLLMEQIAKELKNIGERLEKIEAKLKK